MKFNSVYNKLALHIEDNTPEQPVSLHVAGEPSECLEKIFETRQEIKDLEAKCEALDLKIDLAQNTYNKIKTIKESTIGFNKEDLNVALTSLNICVEYCQFDKSEFQTYSPIFKVNSESDTFTAIEVASEDLSSVLSKMFTMLKNFIIKIIDLTKKLYVEIVSLYPILQTNMTKLITYLTDRMNQPRNQISREQLRWIINKAPVIFAMCKDPAEIRAFLHAKRLVPSIGSIYEDGLLYGNAILNAKKMRDDTFLVDQMKRVTDTIMNTPDKSVYVPLIKILPELEKESTDGKICIIRGDGRTIKFRRLYLDGEDAGIPVIRAKVKTTTIDPINEERILVGKIYSLEEVISILRDNLSFVSEIRTFYNGLSQMIAGSRKMVNGIEDLMVGTTANESLKQSITRNFYNITKTGLGLLNSDILLGYYNTARDIYYAMHKYADLWFNKSLGADSNK